MARPESQLAIPRELPGDVYRSIGAGVVGAFESAQISGDDVSMRVLERIIQLAIDEGSA